MSKHKLLILDDEQPILDSLFRLFRRDYTVCCFIDAEEALHALENSEFATIISDMRMPKMSGAEFLQKAHEIKPDTPRLLLTGYSDLSDTTNAINLGKISNYIAKPWQNVELKAVVAQAVEQYQLRQSVYALEKELVEKNAQLKDHNVQLEKRVNERTAKLQLLAKGLKKEQIRHKAMFKDVIEMINLIIEDTTGEHDGHVKRVASHCRLLAEKLGLDKSTISHCYLTGLMHEIGKITLEDSLSNANENELDHAQLKQRQNHAIKGAAILSKVPNLQPVAQAINHQYEWFNGSGYPDHLAEDDIPIASKVLAVVNDYDKLVIGKTTGTQLSTKQAQTKMRELSGRRYEPEYLLTYFKTLENVDDLSDYHIDMCISVEQLEEGMQLSRDVKSRQGAVLITEGTEITVSTIEKLKQYQKDWDYIFNVFVH